MHFRSRHALLVLTVLLMACGSALRTPTEADARRGAVLWAGYGLRDLSEGHRLYILKCSSCHALYRPQELAGQDWQRLFPEMSGKARLTESEGDLILKYLLVMTSPDRSSTSKR